MKNILGWFWRDFKIKTDKRDSDTTAKSNNEEGVWGKCKECGEPLRAFYYYRDKTGSTYCKKCGKPYQAVYAAPYRTIELIFSGIQKEGISFTVEIEKWPSLECSSLCWREWNQTGGVNFKVDLPANYMSEHTVEEFIEEYIMIENEITKHIPFSISKELLSQIKNRLIESDVLQKVTDVKK